MARMPIIVMPGVPLHVVHQGIGPEPMFFHPQDYATYLIDLGEAAAIHGCAVHAYVLMPGHVRLLLTPAEPDSPSRLMQSLGRRHAQHAHRRQGRTAAQAGMGHRAGPEAGTRDATHPRATPLHSDRDVLACSRLIELDPVRAGTVSEPVAYRWSSFRANGLGARDAALTPHPTYLALGSTNADRQRAYRALFERRLDAEAVRLIRHAPAIAHWPSPAGSASRPRC